MSPFRRACVVAAGVAMLVAGCSARPVSFHATDLTGVDWGRGLALPDPDGRTRTLEEFKGRLVLVFFGFAQCPDVCPTALTRAVEVRRLLGPDGDAVQVVFVTVDPARDTPGVLREYMAAFDPSFIGLRGDDAQTSAAAKAFRVVYMKVPTGGSYTMDHTAVTYVFDRAGRLRLAVPHAQSAADLADDLRKLL